MGKCSVWALVAANDYVAHPGSAAAYSTEADMPPGSAPKLILLKAQETFNVIGHGSFLGRGRTSAR
jgi:hypothetical protein